MIYAIFNYPDSGYICNVKYAQEKGLVKGQKYEMANASVGQSNSKIYLKGFDGLFNSVQFDFIDENGDTVDIYHNPAYSSYCSSCKCEK